MYSILLVDDEPLILSGIKSLLDWDACGCQITATARNGKEALDKIRVCHPDIVFCDINMPVSSGISLLETVSEENPEIVFVMLTNLQDFDLVQSAIRYRALDYIVKNQMDSETLKTCLEKAKKEADNRRKLANVHSLSVQNQTAKEEWIRKVMLSPVSSAASSGEIPAGQISRPEFNSCCAAYILLEYDTSSAENRQELFTWEKEMTEAIAEKHFSSFLLFPADDTWQRMLLFCQGLPAPYSLRKDLFEQFFHKLSGSSRKITNISISMMVTGCFSGIQNISDCRRELDVLLDIYYNSETSLLLFDSLEPVETHSLKLTGITAQFTDAIREKNTARCSSLIDRIIRRIREVFHRRSEAVWICSEIYTASCETLRSMVTDAAWQESAGIFQTETVLVQINGLYTRTRITDWLTRFCSAVCALITQLSQDRNQFIEMAKEYVEKHLEEHISLSDAADYVNISPAYLSSLFQKSCNESFINYINRRKIDHACHLIRENKYLIYEISYRLGFNNAYYFTKIFKRYTGMTPSEYQNSLKKD